MVWRLTYHSPYYSSISWGGMNLMELEYDVLVWMDHRLAKRRQEEYDLMKPKK